MANSVQHKIASLKLDKLFLLKLPVQQIINRILRHKKDLLVVTLGQLIAALGTLFGVRLLTEFISPTVFGEYKLLLAAISLMTGIFIRPFIQFAMREYHDAEKTDVIILFLRNIRGMFRKYIFGVAILFAVIIYFSNGGLLTVPSYLLLLLPLVLVLTNSVELERALMVTQNRQAHASLVSIGRNWLIPIAAVTMTMLATQSVGFLFVGTMVGLVGILLLQLRTELEIKVPVDGISGGLELAGMRHEALKYGLPLAAVGLLSWFVHESDRFFLSYYHSQEVVGIYSAAYGLVSAPFTLVVGSMAQFLYPIMFKVSASGNQKSKLNVLKAMLITSSAICLIGVVIVSLFDEQIAWLALGEDYRQKATGLLIWIAMGYGFLAVSMSFDLAAYGGKRTSDMFIAYGIAAILNVSFNVALIPEYGAKGAVIATLISLFFYLITMAALFLYRERNFGESKFVA